MCLSVVERYGKKVAVISFPSVKLSYFHNESAGFCICRGISAEDQPQIPLLLTFSFNWLNGSS